MNAVRFLRMFSLCAFLAGAIGCGKPEPANQGAVQELSGYQAVKTLIDTSGNRLIMFDLYADWCMPCRVLSPVLEKIAVRYKDRVAVYKINIDKDPEIAREFDVSGIPFVLLIKNKKAVRAFTGVQPEGEYVRAILEFGETEAQAVRDEPDGDLVNGVRVIRISTATSPGDIYVYRGEEVKLVVEKVDFPYSVHIPAYKISQTAAVGQDLEVAFKAVEAGVFPLFCNGKCPTGDGQRFGRIVVLEYEVSSGKAEFRSINAKKAMEHIASEKPLILDVRTPHEFYQGYIPGATLIPVQQLAERIGEIEQHKGRPVLVYCRVGNRSIVASQVLIRNGFKKVYNLKGGIVAWEKAAGQVAR